jgi:hypothetical protein
LVHQIGFGQTEVKGVQSFGQAGFRLCGSGGCRSRACCPNGTERGCPTRSGLDCH